MQNIIDQLQFWTTLECLDPTKNYFFTLHLWCPENNENIVWGGGLDWYQISLSNIDSLFSWPEFCEAVQDCVGDAIQWFDYNDAINQWLINNPFPITIVSADPGNLITIGGDSGAFLNEAWLATAVQNLETLTQLEYYETATDNGLQYTDENGTVNTIKLWHTETIIPVPNIATVITHWLNSTRVHVQVYDIATDAIVDVEVKNRTANTIEVVSTTNNNLEVIIKR